MKTNQFLFDAACGKTFTDEETSEAYKTLRAMQQAFKKLPKKTFTLTKGDKTREVSATCVAEIEANPANKGWDLQS